MKTARLLWAAVALAVVLGPALAAQAQLPDAGGGTIWHFFGLPQARLKLRDNLANRRGNRPGLERKPPLKALADPANLESEVPAIKAAAEIKAQEDLKEQKIKAIKYLASVGCGCYPGVKEALLAALEDCTEEVRLEAAVAFCEASGNPCKTCNLNSCCDADVIAKLKEKAFGQDEKGCYKEQSAQVRSAAARALSACQRIVPPAAPPTRAKKELPVETPGKELPTPFEGVRGVDGRLPPLPGGAAPRLIRPVSTGPFEGRGVDGPLPPLPDDASTYVRPASVVEPVDPAYEPRFVSTTACPPPRASRICPRGHRHRPGYRRPRPCPPSTAAPTEAPKPGEVVVDEPTIEEPLVAPPTALAGTFGGAPAPFSAAPNMIGDFFGGGLAFNNFSDAGQTGFPDSTVAIAGGDRRFKIVEANRPIPTNRFFVNYNHFHNAVIDVAGVHHSFERYTFGVEKTFMRGLWSAELRVPFGTGIDSSQLINQSVVATEFGNIAVALKGLLWQRRNCVVGAGLGFVFPTGEDTSLLESNPGAATVVTVRNEAVHLQPFIGSVWMPNDRLFVQTLAQLDFDANGNRVDIFIPTRFSERVNDQNLLYLDVSAGYWMYKNRRARWVTGIAPVVELHYSTTLQDTDGVVDLSGQSVTNPANRMDVLNITGGVHLNLGACSTLTLAAVAPLRQDESRSLGNEHRVFDAEFTLQYNRRF
ncbi:MAG: hypothetical protein ACYTG0_31205 [Planctomycetota bacterium]|jgi:hypothetical protein